jgi:hypothetical protein
MPPAPSTPTIDLLGATCQSAVSLEPPVSAADSGRRATARGSPSITDLVICLSRLTC